MDKFVMTVDRNLWNRKIVNFLWFVNAMVLISQIAGFLLVWRLRPEQISLVVKVNFVEENLSLLLIVVLTELITRLFPQAAAYVILGGSICFSFIVMLTAPAYVHGTFVVLVLPIFISVIYFERRKLIFTGSLLLFLYVLVLFLSDAYRKSTSPFDVLVVAGTVIGLTVTGLMIMERGIMLLKHLQKTMNSERELLIRNIMMDRMTKIDALTDVYNHRTFHEFLANLIEQHRNQPFAFQLALIDIDNFKKVNDTYGHAVGDHILKVVAGIIKTHAAPDDFVSRYGGEEFAVILLEKTLAETEDLLELIRLAIMRTRFAEMDDQPVTVSIGLRECRGERKEELFKHADSALYAAKRAGKNRLVVFDKQA